MLLDKEIRILEKNGHHAAAFTLRKWQNIIKDPKSIYNVDTKKELIDKISKMTDKEIVKYTIEIITFNWPETKHCLLKEEENTIER